MASINGFTIKNLNQFVGHEGETLFQGNLYLNDKALGFWSQGDWGGPDRFMLDGGWKQEKALDDSIKAMYPEKAIHGVANNGEPYMIEYGLEFLMSDLLDLMNDEQHFKNSVKEGYSGIIVATDGYHEVVWSLKKGLLDLSDEALLKSLEKTIDNAKVNFYKEDEFTRHRVKIYRSLNDFVVGEPIELLEISVDTMLSDSTARSKSAESNSKTDFDFEKE